MTIPYRTRRVLRVVGIVALILLIACILISMCWVLWLERYIIYTRDGAHIDYSLDLELPQGQVALPPEAAEEIDIYFNEGENSVETSNELTQLSGYYIDIDRLSTDPYGAYDAVSALPAGSAVMIDVKSINGSFYYTSSLPDAMYGSTDLKATDKLIEKITKGDYYAIARLPAFRDYYYGLNHVSCGLSNAAWGEGYLWRDNAGCYWLNPANSGALNWIMSIIDELKRLGFDEVVLTEFRFPDTDNIIFSADKTEALQSAMDSLFKNCATNSFTLSFAVTTPTFTLPGARSRMYMENVDGKSADQLASQANVTDTAVQLVFVSETNDTRFDAYSVLRDIEIASDLQADDLD